MVQCTVCTLYRHRLPTLFLAPSHGAIQNQATWVDIKQYKLIRLIYQTKPGSISIPYQYNTIQSVKGGTG